MGVTKTENYTQAQVELSKMIKVLGHPARIAILQSIMKAKSCICGDLVEEIGLAQSTISQHLKELKNIGLITGNIEGTSVCYCIDNTKWSEMKNTLHQFLNQDILNNNCC